MSYEPTLTLNPTEGYTQPLQEVQPTKKEETIPVNLTSEEQKMVDDFAAKIDLTDSTMILQFGSGAQKKVADFSEAALENVKVKDLGEIGEMLTQVVLELKDLDTNEQEKGFFAKLKRSGDKLEQMKLRFGKAEGNITRICKTLENHQIQLLKDIAMLDKMYELNTAYFKELSMYIMAGKQKLLQVQQSQLPQLRQKAEQTGLPEDIQAVNDLSAQSNRFEKKIHDLELTRMISLQMAPQLRMVQGNNTQISEKIQSTLVNTIPLWKSQMVLAIGMSHSQQAAKAHKEVTDTTNELLRKNAEVLKMATVETARESERGIVDMETIRYANDVLIHTLDEVAKIQQDGKQKRKEAEVELVRIEEELKKKLLEISR